jgi:tyrosine-specific transport protein
LSYVGFVILGLRYISVGLLDDYNWAYSGMILPIAFTSFAYQGIVPTLTTYLHHDTRAIRKVILIGSFIPLVAYVIWEALILGIVPLEGVGGLAEALENGDNAVAPLKNFIGNSSVYFLGQSFAFFALVTSFLGVTLGLRDFLADGLQIKKDAFGKLILSLLIFTLPLFISVSYPHIFLQALDYAGGFGVALLLGLLPIVMAWLGRYYYQWGGEEQLPGGRMVLVILALFVLFEVANETKHLFQKFFN